MTFSSTVSFCSKSEALNRELGCNDLLVAAVLILKSDGDSCSLLRGLPGASMNGTKHVGCVRTEGLLLLISGEVSSSWETSCMQMHQNPHARENMTEGTEGKVGHG